MRDDAKPILVIGGGVAGMTAAVEAAEVGYRVILVEKEAYLGGRVVQMARYFPKMCPPACGFEINVRRIRENPRITVYTSATVEEVTGAADNLKARVKVKPSYAIKEHLLNEAVLGELTSERANDFNYGMDKTKALYRAHGMAYPDGYVLDKEALSDADAAKLSEVCDLDMAEDTFEVKVGSVVVATGWRPYDANKLDTLGFGQYPNVITNVMMERLAAKDGPTGGEIIRPSDGKKAVNVAFVQCAGSRDINHLPYCSAVCCMASLKETRLLREINEDARATIFYIDVRTLGRAEKFYFDILEDENVTFVKGKVAKINEESASGNLTLDVEDTLTRENLHEQFDLVVLATGMVPNTDELNFPFELSLDEYGFLDGADDASTIHATGCAKRPCDVARTTKDSAGIALKAIQSVNEGD